MSETNERPQPHANAARTKLHEIIGAAYRRTFGCGAAVAQAMKAASHQEDIAAYYAESGRLILALETLHKAAEAAAKDCRSALQLSMQDTGCPQVNDPGFTIYLQKEPAFLEIIDEGRIPPDLWTKPKPEPDRKAIKAAIDAGRTVPGASYNVRNSQRLVIRGKSS